MNERNQILSFDCHGDRLLGILHLPSGKPKAGVLIVTGGPQYRVGSHRQFILLARALAMHGIAAMRFDYRGMGDSEGEPRPYYLIQHDLCAAISAFKAAIPSLSDLVLWGLCDGATAAANYAPGDERVCGLILLNPWVHSTSLQQRVLLRHYYLQRLRSRELWASLLRGRLALASRISAMFKHAALATKPATEQEDYHLAPDTLLYDGLSAFSGRVLILLAEADYVAKQLLHLRTSRPGWQRLLARSSIRLHTIAGANHTFASQRWRDAVITACIDWIHP